MQWVRAGSRIQSGLGFAAIVGFALALGMGAAWLPGDAIAQEGQSPAGGEVLFGECFDVSEASAAETALLRAECDTAAADGGYTAGVWRPFQRRVDGNLAIKCTTRSPAWVCAGVPSEAAGPPAP